MFSAGDGQPLKLCRRLPPEVSLLRYGRYTLLTVPLVDLREHAILALRNILHGNKDNQALVEEIQPMTEWDADGILQGRTSATQR